MYSVTVEYSYLSLSDDHADVLFAVGIVASSHISVMSLSHTDGTHLSTHLVAAPWIKAQHKYDIILSFCASYCRIDFIVHLLSFILQAHYCAAIFFLDSVSYAIVHHSDLVSHCLVFLSTTRGWAFDRVYNSRQPLDCLFALCDSVTLNLIIW